ncbi:MAG: hypothetical protein QNJ68_19125 [Microcoleaceae cyanobacterium MO_207.B10]|nr:hypothetical protein [Microcoleaceae cyanobacterium MO_207.B10]
MTNLNATFCKNPFTKVTQNLESELPIWDSLKQTIAGSAGFQRWQQERNMNNNRQQTISLDQQVSLYLRETLETLAY